MKKAVRLSISGSMQSLFFRQFVKNNADGYNLKGFLRIHPDSRVEIFLEGNMEDVDKVVDIFKKGPKYSQIRSFEEKPEKLQDFKEFKVLTF